MRWLKGLAKISLVFVFIIGLLALIATLTGNGYLVKGVRLTYLKGTNTANIYDGLNFDTRQINASTNPFIIPKAKKLIAISDSLNNLFKTTKTSATILIVNDSIQWETYYNKHTKNTQSNSFSAVKTMVCFLIQRAIQQQKITNWQAKAITYLPWLKGKYAADLTLQNLATMSSGLNWEEGYTNPFCVTAKAYYGNHILKLMQGIEITEQPGKRFRYQSGNTQLLSFILTAVYNKPLSQIMETELWQPIGAQYNATWSLDKTNGNELAYCCLNAIAQDFAKFGLLTLHHGKFNNQQIIDSTYITMATTPAFSTDYGIGFWLGEINGVKYSLFQGHLGQFIAIIPSKNAVFVRLGEEMKAGENIPSTFKAYLTEVLKQLK